MTSPSGTEEEMEFDWLQLHRDMEKLVNTETSQEKFFRKFKENPLVPIGALATTAALGYGLWTFRKGQRRMSQLMMRTRVLAQGFTVVALVIGIGLSAKNVAIESTNDNSAE